MANRDALSQLPEFSWRGELYPLESARHSFRHDNSEHRISYGGKSIIEPLGPQNPTFSYTIPMDQGVAKGPYKDLFTKVSKLARSLYDRTPGELVDPVYGNWIVTPTEYSSTLDARRRSGVPAEVGFVWSPDLDNDVKNTGGVGSLSGLASDAGALDEAVTILARKYDQAAKKPMMNPLSLVSNITGNLSRSIDKIKGKLQKFTYEVQKTEAFVGKLASQTRDPDAFGAHREARRIRASAIRTQKQINALVRDVGQITLAQNKNVLTVAAEAGMTVKDLLSLNTQLASDPVVKAGTIVQVYKKQNR